jgi:hypothetical protein
MMMMMMMMMLMIMLLLMMKKMTYFTKRQEETKSEKDIRNFSQVFHARPSTQCPELTKPKTDPGACTLSRDPDPHPKERIPHPRKNHLPPIPPPHNCHPPDRCPRKSKETMATQGSRQAPIGGMGMPEDKTPIAANISYLKSKRTCRYKDKFPS